ncbi:hypothetical protein GCM10010174_15170 [Kutzneria viridogrisea]|uniref:Tetratricopeptide repeat protein n=1 Tax=Kutzneria viridogrisea TaxID=47990 RepID=A0ABR6BGX6_9PSEU|nr:hypothetical protein [Kutzneria viridogrisea]
MRPSVLLPLAVLLAVVLVERDPVGALVGAGGAVAGALIGFAVLQLGVLAGGLLLGARVSRVVVGVGGRVRDWKLGARTVTLRRLPVMLSVTVGPGRAPVRPRLWATSLVSALCGLAACVLLAVLGDGPFWHGAALGATAAVGMSLWPRRTVSMTSTGWILANYLRLAGREAAELDAAPLVSEASAAVRAGDMAAAEQVARELGERYPALQSAVFARVIIMEARGEYGPAMQLVLGMMRAEGVEQRDFTLMMAGLAGLAAAAVEAGQLDRELGLHTTRQSMADAEQLGYPAHKLNGTKALLALLEQDTESAITLATKAAYLGEDVVGRADDLATLARAHMVAGDNAKARSVLAEAERLAPWWPRVVGTRERLDVC